jgi:hypothetical protein
MIEEIKSVLLIKKKKIVYFIPLNSRLRDGYVKSLL